VYVYIHYTASIVFANSFYWSECPFKFAVGRGAKFPVPDATCCFRFCWFVSLQSSVVCIYNVIKCVVNTSSPEANRRQTETRVQTHREPRHNKGDS